MRKLKDRIHGDTLTGLEFRLVDSDGAPVDLTDTDSITMTWHEDLLKNPALWTLTVGAGLTLSTVHKNGEDLVPATIVVDEAIPPLTVGTFCGKIKAVWTLNSRVQTLLFFKQRYTQD